MIRKRPSPKRRRGRARDRGVALLVVLIALLLVTAVAAGMILLSNGEINVDANYRDEQVALFAAKAGLEEARDRLLTSNANPIVPPNALPGSTGGAAYITAAGITPWTAGGSVYNVSTYDTEFVNNELTAAGLALGPNWYAAEASDASYYGNAANPLPYQWVRINLKVDASAVPYSVDGIAVNGGKQVVFDTVNLHECVLGTTVACSNSNTNLAPVYEITSFAVTASGTRRMLQEEVSPDTVNLPLAGALTVDGPGLLANTVCASGTTCSTSGDYLTGTEPASCPSTNVMPAIAVADSTSQADIAAGVNPNAANIVGCTTVSCTTTGNDSVVNESAALSSVNTVSQVEVLVAELKTLAGSNIGPDCTTLNLGTSSNPKVAVVTNAGGTTCNVNSGTSGYGILVVTGSLTYANVNAYQGVILMLGTGQFRGSSTDTSLSGALFIAQDRDTASGALLAGPALGSSPTFHFHYSPGSSTDPSIQFNQCLISQVEASAANNYRVLSQREITF
jgi:hypothetical protein